jgi:hypothetical protein
VYLNPKEITKSGIDKWHEAGYKGQGMKFGVIDISGIDVNLPMFDGKVKDAFHHWPPTHNSHAQNQITVIREIAPEAEIVLLGHNAVENLKYCIEHELDVVNQSTTGGYTLPEWMEIERQAIEKGTFFVCSAGNDGANGLTGQSRKDTWLSVGAVHVHDWDNDRIVRADYSSHGEKELDIMSFSSLTVPHTVFGTTNITGTSFSSPFAAAMILLYKQWFKATHDRKPTFEEVMAFVTLNCTDLELPGHDVYTGHGLFRLPDPDELPKKKERLEVLLGNDMALKNGQVVHLYHEPIIANGRLMVGIRDIGELFGFNVSWDKQTKKAIIEEK